uniref:Cadherin domain-containing protein n=1 Tax=Macrostomum lignano TaxID=282301 RepID=A0A1I8F7F2_9PLAT
VSDQCFPTWASATKRQPVHSSLIDRELNSSIACTVTAHDAENRSCPLPSEFESTSKIRTTVRRFPGHSIRKFYIQSARELAVRFADWAVGCQRTTTKASMVGRTRCFEFCPDGGIKLVARQLDRERSNSHRLFVKAMDHGSPPRWTTAEVLIQVLDENDNSPRFLFPSNRNSTLNVSVHERPGAELAMISADDADFGDNGRLVYSLLGAADTNVIASTTNAVSMPFCDVSLFHLNPSSGLLVLRQSPPIRFADSRVCKLTVRAEDAGPLASARRSSQQSLTVHWTAAQEGEGGEGVSDGQPAGDAGRNRGLDGGGSDSGAHDLVVVTVCVGLSFLVLLCVVLLLAYFCYYLQLPGQAAAENSQDGAARGVGGSRRATGDGLARGRKKRRAHPESSRRMAGEAGTWRRPSNNGGNFDDSTSPTAEHRSDRAMGGRGYYQRPRYQQNQMHRRNSEDSDVASAMLPQYAAAAVDASDTDLEIGANSKTSFFRGGLGRLNSMSSEGAKKRQLSGDGRTAEGGGRGGFVYGSPYLTSSFV